MNLIRSKAFAVIAATFGLAAVLGGSLGMVAAQTREPTKISEGMNLIGGPRRSIATEEFMACVDDSGWIGIYRWDNRSVEDGGQRWLHFLNGVPAYVNDPRVNGMQEIPAGAGLVLLASKDFQAYFKHSPTETCP